MPLLIVAGPTATGKTKIAIELALRLGAEIISADSMQIYKYMDIGTAKPSPEERKLVPHHLIDLISPAEPFTVADYQRVFQATYEQLQQKGVLPLLTGGTGLYIRAVTRGYNFPGPPVNQELRASLRREAEARGKEEMHRRLAEVDPESAGRIHPNDLKRVLRALEVYLTTGAPISSWQKGEEETLPEDIIYIGLTRDREELYHRIELRVDLMIAQGLLEEVRSLLEMGFGPELQSMQGLGYKELVPVVKGEKTLAEAVRLLKKRTRNYAKRQMTWFRKEPVEKWFLLSGPEEESFPEILTYIEGRIGAMSNT
ncbi:MAG: tRNA (adenosine(37)-N6)-dimethylallyltransferase MiaA [Clostridia bacterium]|nr:tRNA (adenosine(37)-N6)-dimethylallyltransferase MiaA [Clostridia bacterium]